MNVEEEVCQCPVANGFRLTPETGYWVHAKCMKPTRPVAIRECDLCHKLFVPRTKYEDRSKFEFMGIACYDCDPD